MKWGQTTIAASSWPPLRHTGRTGKDTSLDLVGSKEKAGVWSQTQSPRQWPGASASGSELDKEGERTSSSSDYLELSGGILSVGTPCDLLLFLSFSWVGGCGWEKLFWDTGFPVQETSPTILGRLLGHFGGGPPQIFPQQTLGLDSLL